MLSPDDLSRAGEEVAAVYRQIEDSMVDALAGLLVSGETRSQTFETAMQLLSQSAVPRIHGVMERNRAHIDEATRSEVGRWLALSDSDDLSRIKAALGVELPGITAREAASVVEGVAGILSRDNLEMERGAAQAFLRHSTWAVTQVSSGAMTAHAAWREAAVRLAGEGITYVTYRDTASGRVTVTNHADVAVRRHVRSQLSQATMSRTLQVCREAGIGFVEVSSHTGARPTHAEWHGRVYSLDGDVTVDGRKYKDFWRGTGYQGKEGPYASLGDRLGGVNCRHSFGPWLPGTPRAYDPDPPHPSGLPNDEVYELTQKQRAQERRIRATKRELMVTREHAEPGNIEDVARVVQLQDKLKRQQASMRKLVDDANSRGSARVLTRAYPRESVAGYHDSPLPISAQSRKRAREVLELRAHCLRVKYPVFDTGPLGQTGRAWYRNHADDGTYPIIMHGTPNVVLPYDYATNHEILAGIIEERRDYIPGTPITLLSCDTGNETATAGDCFAQRLANRMGVVVHAPTGKLWVLPDGRIEVGANLGDNDGSMKPFSPRST